MVTLSSYNIKRFVLKLTNFTAGCLNEIVEQLCSCVRVQQADEAVNSAT